jgi:predicted DNA-binding transcriptional regulator
VTIKQAGILTYIEKKGQVSAHELAGAFSLSGSMVHRHLKNLIMQGLLIKNGTPPKVYYSSAPQKVENPVTKNIDQKIVKIIDDNFTLLEPQGTEIVGFNGFVKWCAERKYDVLKKASEYVETLTEYDNFRTGNFIDATQKINTSFSKEKKFLDALYYLYPYSLPVFGKTKMGSWLFHAKQTQNRELMDRVLTQVTPLIQIFIKENKIDAVAFVPPTVPRSLQFMKELEKSIKVSLPIIKIEKIKTPITIQQKSLKDIGDRIINAEATMVVPQIQDFTGSGSTLNIIAGKIKRQKITNTVIGLTITGSMNGFEVVREV